MRQRPKAEARGEWPEAMGMMQVDENSAFSPVPPAPYLSPAPQATASRLRIINI
jgi:hypothetical protein